MPPRSPEDRATELLREAGVNGVLPVPVDQLATFLGVRVVLQRMDSHLSGMTYRQGEEKVVGVNSNHHARRRRFTLAHELGHVRMHPGRPLLVDSSIRVDFRDSVSSLATDREEIEANRFAAELLMPAPLVIERMRTLTNSGVRGRDRVVNDLANTFDVSAEAMGYRLINLGLTTA